MRDATRPGGRRRDADGRGWACPGVAGLAGARGPAGRSPMPRRAASRVAVGATASVAVQRPALASVYRGPAAGGPSSILAPRSDPPSSLDGAASAQRARVELDERSSNYDEVRCTKPRRTPDAAGNQARDALVLESGLGAGGGARPHRREGGGHTTPHTCDVAGTFSHFHHKFNHHIQFTHNVPHRGRVPGVPRGVHAAARRCESIDRDCGLAGGSLVPRQRPAQRGDARTLSRLPACCSSLTPCPRSRRPWRA